MELVPLAYEDELNSTFTNDLKRKYFFRKMFIVADLASLKLMGNKILTILR